ncbi:HEAT repeat domain-containing protein [Myxococcus landrumensis]|uniref:HEAT repeat domain-containing protein n=1 Tax=Myxococcus landrumensis TaxID=2813577 RepID=A0ABX7NEB6_9BACT|nr:HEAT repeat domain-containing protein [Myxococcus landrumus]QSQ15844.1 HEAT repeat domain-containing protein [Myxococcus landrumus]
MDLARLELAIQRVRRAPDPGGLAFIAEFGEQANPHAGELVAGLMGHRNADVRVFAARTVGLIQHAEARDALVACLDDVVDWRLVLAAAESLGRLRAAKAIESLERVSAAHWFPPVRDAARKSIRVIRGEDTFASEKSPRDSFFTFFDAWTRERNLLRPALTQAPDELPPPVLVQRTFTSMEEGREAETLGRLVAKRRQPTCGLRVPGGFLLGLDRGEWRGTLAYQSEDATQESFIAWDNIHGLHRVGSRIFAVTGLAHLGGNEGHLFLVEPRESTYAITPWRELPGAPEYSGWLPDGRLCIVCIGACVVVTLDGALQALEASEAPLPPA